MPMIMPGMKPAAKDLPEKSSDLSSLSLSESVVAAASAEEVLDDAGSDWVLLAVDEVVLDADEVVPLVAEEDPFATSLSVIAIHSVPEHLKPIGQHASPQVSSLAVGSEWS